MNRSKRVAGGCSFLIKAAVPFFLICLLWNGPIFADPAASGPKKISGAPEESEEWTAPAGSSGYWDFTKALPAGGKLRSGASLNGGLLPKTFDISKAGGYQLFKNDLKLTPAFRFEAQITPGVSVPECEKDLPLQKEGVIWDSMYVNYKKEPANQFNRGFQIILRKTGENRWQPTLYLGDGKTTYTIPGPVAEIPAGKSVKLAFDYDANGSIFWTFADKTRVSQSDCIGPIAPSRYIPVIGDRYGSNYDSFPGKIERIAIIPRFRAPLGLLSTGRKVYYRGEKDAKISFRLIRANDEKYVSLKLTSVFRNGIDGPEISRNECDATPLLTEGTTLSIPLETRFSPGNWLLDQTLTAVRANGSKMEIKHTETIGIGPVFADRFPALMWGFNGRPFQELIDFGFTHGVDSVVARGIELQQGIKQQYLDRFDQALLKGMLLVSHVGAAAPEEKKDEFYRMGKNGKAVQSNRKPMLEVLNPEVIEYSRKSAAMNAKAFGSHPAFAGVLINTERRDGVAPSFAYDPDLYRSETGKNFPAEAAGSMPSPKIGKTRFPNGIVPDNDDLLQFYSWFWNGGDGWPRINTVIAEEYRSVIKPPFFSFFDPAVRVPPKWGSGGSVDVLSQWIYAVPEPLSVAGPTEELFAMAAGNHQNVMIMTQIICYRSQIAPKTKKISDLPAWVNEKPDADFPTIPPDSIQEATWAMIAKPVKGIMYHGYGCIVDLGNKKGYTYTNAETPKRLKYLLKDVVAPLGPMLQKLPREDSPVAILESFSNALFSGSATWGWKAPDILFLQRARLDPRVVYDETILRDGLGNAKVLYMPQCSYLSAKVCEKILEFQKKGGIIIGDEKLLSAIRPNIAWGVVDRENALKRNRMDNIEETGADQNDVAAQKRNMNAQASALREKLAPHYTPRADSSTPELITFSRRWHDVDYLFVINDHRTYGDYVGQWKMTMEKGLPQEGSITLADPDRKIGAVYELSRGEKLSFARTENGSVRVGLNYKTNDGRLLMFLQKPIGSLSLKVPETVQKGESVSIKLRVFDSDGKPVRALLPVEIRMFDSEGKELDGAGFACAEAGVCSLKIATNLNDPDGKYRITAKDRASGLTVEKTVQGKRISD
ncbi:MAG: hypothetical protein Q4G69_07235 [Planctomycetia bacterium]|nr:hypothetical protein [Planctomycetia bacterium]